MAAFLSGAGGMKDVDTPVNDCAGKIVGVTPGTPFWFVVTPKADGRACLGNWRYKNGAAVTQTITVMTAQGKANLTSDAEIGATTIKLADVPALFDGTSPTASDLLVVRHEQGDWAAYTFLSIAGKVITVSSALTDKLLSASKMFFMGNPANDHALRRFEVLTTEDFVGPPCGDTRLRSGTASENGTPILVHSDNAGAVNGYFRYIQQYYD